MKVNLAVLLFTMFLACDQVADQPNIITTKNNITTILPSDIIGKTIENTYGESIYHVTIDSDHEMHWEAMSGDEKGTKEEENYKIESIDYQKLFITWGEANGIGVSQVLDFEKGVVYNHLLRGREISIGTGEIRILEK